MKFNNLVLDPTGECDIQSDLVARIKLATFQSSVPLVVADRRSVDEAGRYIVVKVGPPGQPIEHPKVTIFLLNVIISAFASGLTLSRDEATDMINVAEEASRGRGATPYEEFCLLQGLPQIRKISDGSYEGECIMRARVGRYKS